MTTINCKPLFAQTCFGWSKVMLALAAVAISGCGDARLPCVKAACELLIDGKPYGPATVTFFRVGAKPEDRGTVATVEKSGSGEISTYQLGDGLPEGDYKVTVVASTVGKSPIAKAYASEATSPLKAQVFANTTIVKLELEAPKSPPRGATGVERFGGKSNTELMEEAMAPQ